ncbi:MAG: DNA translocase FtsK 4TM domain-containing protein [Parvularculaceae bacterium]
MPRKLVRQRTKPPSLLTSLAGWLRALVARAGGAAMLLLAAWLVVSLATFSISDPSLNVATGRSAGNWGGAAGASVADVLLQLLGGASLLFVAPLAIWGALALTRGVPQETPGSFWLRLALLPVAVIAAAVFAAFLPAPADWPFVAGAGGIIGNVLRDSVTTLSASWRLPILEPLAGGLALAMAFTAYLIVCGLTLQRAEDAYIEGDYYARITTAWITEQLHRLSAWKSAETRGPTDANGNPKDEEVDSGDAEEDTEPPLVAPLKKRQIIRRKSANGRGAREHREAQAELPVFEPGSYEFPPLNLLAKPQARARVVSDDALEQNARMLENVLADFGVKGEIQNVRPGPVVTLYELEPAAGVKSSRIIGLSDDIARSMSAVAARVAVVPGRNAIGIELPNHDREMVYLRELLGAEEYEGTRGDLTLALGKSIGGEPVFADLARMPHLLIAGTTGSGKSVGINTMILSLLFRLAPDDCKLIMIDPKMLELSVYEGIPHLLAPVVTDPKKAVVALKWTVREMEERYRRMSKLGVRNIEGYNQRVAEAEESGEALTRTVHTGYDQASGEAIYETEDLDYKHMPFIVVVIDEVADLMMVAGKDIEGMVQRLAQMARAAGIHLIMATQRPSVDVITGTIKANFPTRISFQVTSKIDSRTILGEQGAEQLLGQGDMLYMAGGGRIRRVHGAFVADDEVEKIVGFLKRQGKPDYVQEVTELRDEEGDEVDALNFDGENSGDALYDKAVAIVLRDRKASTSYIQRRLQIGYNRAATLMERMESEGVVSMANHAGKRDILVGEDAA